MSAAHVAVAVQGASWRDPDSVPLMVAQAILGSWDKNRPTGTNQAAPISQQLATNDLASSYMARMRLCFRCLIRKLCFTFLPCAFAQW